MARLQYTTLEALAASMSVAGSPTPDDVSTLNDGTKIDSREAALKWLREVATLRSNEQN